MRKFNIFFVTALVFLFLAGCHEDNIFHWITPESPPVEIDQPEVMPEEEVGVLEPDPTPEPPCELIKGNISSSGEKIYHLPDGQYYDRVKIDESTGEGFFCSEEEAQVAGFRKSQR